MPAGRSSRSAWQALRARTLNMNVPISLGVILALAMSVVETANHAKDAYYDSAIMLLFFLLVGRALEHAMRRKTRATAGNLAALRAETAHRFAGDELVSVPLAMLQAGDRVLVKPGERVPADGEVRRGNSEIDDSLITGETARRKIAQGATVYAGSLNFSGTLTMRVTASGGSSLIDEIEKLLDKAASAKSRTMRLADRAAAYLCADGACHRGADFHRLVAGRRIGARRDRHRHRRADHHLSLRAGAGHPGRAGGRVRRAVRHGVILNTGDAIERLAEADTVIFDKTGTLTLPEPRVVNAADIDPELLQMAARLALSSRHPLALALAREAVSATPFDGGVEEPGQGVRVTIDGAEARLGSAAFCGVPVDRTRPACRISSLHTPAGSPVFAIAPETAAGRRRDRAGAAQSRARSAYPVRRPRRRRCAPVAEALGIPQWRGELNPAEKIALIETLKAQGRRVLMVGDGLNDAPALAAAHVSLSPITAADMTQAQADAVFLGERLDAGL